jgi:hypothetical protein
MLTDTEVADTARHLLSEELADLNPPAGLLADVRARHVRTLRTRRAATTALATIAAAAVTTGIATTAGPFAASAPRHTSAATLHSAAARTPAQKATGAQAQTITLDGYQIRVKAGLRLTGRRHGQLIASFGGRPVTLTLLLHGGPVPAAALRVSTWQRPAYLLHQAGQLSLYLPFPVAHGYHSLVVSGARLTKAELLRIAAAITVGGQPGFLKSMPSPVPASHCPCG